MTCKINKADAAKKRNRNGQTNLVARYRRTRKGEKLTVNGEKWGVDGRDGSDYYSIQLGSDGVLYCSCADYKFHGHKSNRMSPGTNYMCKHIRAYLIRATTMIAQGVSMDSEAIIYNEPVTVAAIVRLGHDAHQGRKVAVRKAS